MNWFWCWCVSGAAVAVAAPAEVPEERAESQVAAPAEVPVVPVEPLEPAEPAVPVEPVEPVEPAEPAVSNKDSSQTATDISVDLPSSVELPDKSLPQDNVKVETARPVADATQLE